jgi:hypothetical protein
VACPAQQSLRGYISGDLGSAELRAVEAHLASCPSCREQISQLTRPPFTPELAPTVTPDLAATVAATGPGAPAQDELRPGATVDHFLIVRRLGEGGMSTVYLAEDTQLRRQVAIKVLKGWVQSGEERDLLLREAQAIARLDHPNIVTVYHAGVVGQQLFLALEYLRGPTLRERLGPGGEPLPVDEAVQLAAVVAEALSEAHRRGVLHRDLKPENVILPASDKPHLVDFGLAALGAGRTEAGDPTGASLETHHAGLRGTPAYMAPEQWLEEPCTPATDVWALGLMLCELLTGRRPYDSSELRTLMMKVTSPAPVPDVRSLARRHLPPALVSLCNACLAKDRERRPSADEVAGMLRAVATSLGEERRRSTPGARLISSLLLLVGPLLVAFGVFMVGIIVGDKGFRTEPVMHSLMLVLIGVIPGGAGGWAVLRGLRTMAVVFPIVWGSLLAFVGLLWTAIAAFSWALGDKDLSPTTWALVLVSGAGVLGSGVLFIVRGASNRRRRARPLPARAG